MSSNIVVRSVYADNVVNEFDKIRKCLPFFPFVSMDTEFPGTVFNHEGVPAHLISTLPPASFYKVMKKNIDELKLIQVGLTLSDANGNLPYNSTGSQFVWEFNFKDFNYETDSKDPDAISLLERQGIDFKKNREHGIDSGRFAQLFWQHVLSIGLQITWVTFHGPYDFGYMVKILTGGRKLPEDVADFLGSVRFFFGQEVFDVKNMIRLFGLHGGLDRVAGSLKLDRVAGKAHQAGSDSLLTMHVFLNLYWKCKMDREKSCTLNGFRLMVYGLTTVDGFVGRNCVIGGQRDVPHFRQFQNYGLWFDYGRSFCRQAAIV